MWTKPTSSLNDCVESTLRLDNSRPGRHYGNLFAAEAAIGLGRAVNLNPGKRMEAYWGVVKEV